MKQEYIISDLKPGMYISEVLEQSGKLKIKSQGIVGTLNAIKSLHDKGVSRVLVDLSKSKLEQELEAPIEESKPEQKTTVKEKSVSFDNEINQASKLFEQAKSIQAKAFNSVKSGKALDTDDVKSVTTGFVDSVFRNQDALACMTRMRMKNEYLLEHSISVSILMTTFAKHLKLETEVIQQLATGAMLMSLGKIAISDSILNKPGPLTDSEMDKIKEHVTLGHKVLSKAGGLSEYILDMVQDHHEHVDGTGYPNGKTGEQFGQYAKMAAIVDSYDAMTSERVYQKAKSPVAAFRILRSESGHKYDTNLVNEFIKCMGIHPVGTLVKMKSNKLGIVTKSNYSQPTLPQVNIFYSITSKCYIEPKYVDLASKTSHDEIEKSVKPEDFRLDMLKFFKQVLLD